MTLNIHQCLSSVIDSDVSVLFGHSFCGICRNLAFLRHLASLSNLLEISPHANKILVEGVTRRVAGNTIT